jgi:hypothetical protein
VRAIDRAEIRDAEKKPTTDKAIPGIAGIKYRGTKRLVIELSPIISAGKRIVRPAAIRPKASFLRKINPTAANPSNTPKATITWVEEFVSHRPYCNPITLSTAVIELNEKGTNSFVQ